MVKLGRREAGVTQGEWKEERERGAEEERSLKGDKRWRVKGEKEEKLGHFLNFYKEKCPVLLSKAKCWVLSDNELL